MTAPSHFCLRCSKYHDLRILSKTGGRRHLEVVCPQGRYVIKYRNGLNIPVIESSGKRREDAASRQIKLL